MQVILQQEVANLGGIGDQVTVRPGYARNFLIPLGKAMPATKENLARFEVLRAVLEQREREVRQAAQQRAEQLHEKTITIQANAGEGGKLFGSIGPREIVKAVRAEGFELAKSEITMPEGPIRRLGEYQITINLHSAVSSTIQVVVIEE